MININDKISSITLFLKDIVDLSDDEVNIIKSSIGYLHELTPTDGPGVFFKSQNLISNSEDLSWVITVVKNTRNKISSQINLIKDPEFTMLIRNGRPSTAAIEHEIRFNNASIPGLEDNVMVLDNIIDYLNKIQLNIDRYIWLLKSKSDYLK